MGSPKALLPWRGGEDLLAHALRRFSAANMPALVLGPAQWAETHGAAHLPDAMDGVGPLGGVLAAVRAGDVFIVAVDMPLLTDGEVRALLRAGEAAGVLTLPGRDGQLRALCGYWPGALATPLADYLAQGGRRVIDFAERMPHLFLDDASLAAIGVRPSHLQGINTPEEYAAARAAAQEHCK